MVHFNNFLRNPFSRRMMAKHTKYLFSLSLGLILLLLDWSLPGFADVPQPPTNPALITPAGEYDSFLPKGDIRRFSGETLFYDIDFLWFKNAASARVDFYEYKGKYFATLLAETKGIVGFFTNYRKHFYKSTFDIVDGGHRVQSSKFEREVINGDEHERTIHFLDYASHTHFWFEFKNGELTNRQKDPIPEGVIYDDILAMFYNFRNGVYGDLNKGESYKVNTIPDKSVKNITADILTEKEEGKFPLEKERFGDNRGKFLLKVFIPKDVFETESGELIFWTSKHYIPLETTVKDYILLGDLHAELKTGVAGKFK